MEREFVKAWLACRARGAEMGIRLRPLTEETAMKEAQRALSGSRESDGFSALAAAEHLELTLEALAVSQAFTALFTDEQADRALARLLDAGYQF